MAAKTMQSNLVGMTKAEEWLKARGFSPFKTWDNFSVDNSLRQYELRREFIKEFGFAILSTEAVECIKKYGPILEVGAGTGYWAYELKQAGVTVLACDPNKGEKNRYPFKHREPWTEIHKLTGTQALSGQDLEIHKYTLMMVWPCYDEPWAYNTLKAYRGAYFIYVGEGRGGCTGDDKFHKLLEEEWQEIQYVNIPRFFGLNDYLTVYVRR